MSGSPRVVVATNQPLPELTWPDEVHEVPHVWPQLAPTWLAATAAALPEHSPWHTVGRRGRGEWAVLPGFVLAEPPGPELDLGGYQARDAAAYPILVLGSLIGRCSDVAYSFWTPRLYASMVRAVVADARDAGIRSVLAPWIPDRDGSDALAREIVDSGGHTVPGGRTAHATLPGDGAFDQVPSARSAQDIVRFDAATLPDVLSQMCDLVAAQPRAVDTLLRRLAEAGVDMSGAVVSRDGQPAAAGVTVRKGHRVFVPFLGAADAEARDTCLRAVLDDQLRRADPRGVRSVELSAPAGLPGERARELTTALLVLDAADRQRVHADLEESAHP